MAVISSVAFCRPLCFCQSGDFMVWPKQNIRKCCLLNVPWMRQDGIFWRTDFITIDMLSSILVNESSSIKQPYASESAAGQDPA